MTIEYIIHPIWIYLSCIFGILGSIIVVAIGTHVIYHEQQSKIGLKASRRLSVLFFTTSLLTCVAFGFFRFNLIFPILDCHLGFYLSNSCVFVSKLLLFNIFLYRIHLAFGSSALRYSTSFLICALITYLISACGLYAAYIVYSWKLVHFQLLSAHSDLGICTTVGSDLIPGNEDARGPQRIVTVLLFLCDVSFSMFVCGLFVHKLRAVIKMTKPESEAHEHRKQNMVLLARKQTALVTIACVTSALTVGMDAVTPGPGYCLSFDAIVNAVCVWLMYKFTKNIWNACIKSICCCCYCCVYKEEFVERMRGISIPTESKQSHTSKIHDLKTAEQIGNDYQSGNDL
eukprot:140960_1